MRSALCCVPPANQLPGRTKYRKSMKRNLSLLLVSLLLQGQLLPKNIIRAAYSRIRFRNPPRNLSGNNALHEQTMAR